jgi:hypothetical protein
MMEEDECGCWFQQDVNEVVFYLGKFVGDCLISMVCGSQDITTPNFYLSDYLYGVVCSKNPHTMGLQAIWSVRQTFKCHSLTKQKNICHCIQERRHFQQLL